MRWGWAIALALGTFALVALGRKQEPKMVYELDDKGLVTLSPGVSVVTLSPDAMDAWRALVKAWDSPLVVKDSYRTTTKGEHSKGNALDVTIPLEYRAGKAGTIEWRRRFVGAAQRAGFTAFGLGYGTIHIDTGPARWWTYKSGKDIGYPAKLEAEFSDRVPPEFAAGGNAVPDLTGVA